MSASFRSTFRSPPAPAQSTSSQREHTQSSRIPTKPESNNVDSKQNKTSQHVSRLARRSSRSNTPSAKLEDSTKSITSTTPMAIPTANTQNRNIESKTVSVLPQSQIVRSGTPYQSISRQNSVLLPPPTLRTPSLVSGSSISTFDSPRSTGLRRKPSTIEQYAASKRAETPNMDVASAGLHENNEGFNAMFTESVLGIALPQTKLGLRNEGTRAIPEEWPIQNTFQSGQYVTRDITPPVPNYAQSVTPSTRYTDSPFSHVPTPSSASSYSSAIVATNPKPACD